MAIPCGVNNPPTFTDGASTTRSVDENTASGQNVGTAVGATDLDNDTLAYTLGGTDASSFQLVPTSGQIQTSAALDYEAKSSYSVEVSVSDGNDGTDSIDVTIVVDDVLEQPGAPQNFVAAAGDGQVTLRWDAPSSDGNSAITGYEYQVDGSGNWTTAGTLTNRTEVVTGLTNGQSYSFAVRAVNAAGGGSVATVSATPRTARPPVPSAPRNLMAAAGDGRVTLTWDAPSGDAVRRYDYRVDGGAWRRAGTDLTVTVTDLTNGTEYSFAVRAVNRGGSGSAATVSATPRTGPGAPQNFVAAAGDTRVTLTWEAPSDDGGAPITGYEHQVDGGAWRSAGTDLMVTVTDLTNGTEYSFAVRAVNAAGGGSAATVSATPRTGPGAPQNFVAAAGDTRVTLTWEAPSDDGGAPITGYEHQVDGGAWRSAGTDLTVTVTDLTNGQSYSLAVRAVNAAGSGAAATVSATPRTEPGAPQNLVAAGGVGQVTLTWDVPSEDGGAPITSYEYQVDGGAWTSAGNALTATVDGLENGRTYTFGVRAVNAAGGGLAAEVTGRPNRPPVFAKTRYAFDLPENRDGRGSAVELARATAKDPDGDAVTHALADGARDRFAVRAQDGMVTYIGPGEDAESEPNEYRLTLRAQDDSGAEAARVQVVVTVTSVNEPPAAGDDEARTEEDRPVTVDVLANDTDPDGDPLQVETVSAAAHGVTEITADGGVAYTPAANYYGADRFTYVVSDGGGLTATGTVDVAVLPVQDAPAPVGVIPAQALDEGGDPVTVDLEPFFEDADGDVLTFRAASSDAQVAAVAVAGAALTIMPVTQV